MYRFRPLQIVTDHRGEVVELTIPDDKGAKVPAPGSIDGKMPLRYLLEQALGDDPVTFSPTGQPNPQQPVEIVERRRRTRLQTEMWTREDEWEVTQDDGEYIVQRANVLMNTAAFGIVDRAWSKAIQVFENEQDAEKAKREAPDEAPAASDGAEPPTE